MTQDMANASTSMRVPEPRDPKPRNMANCIRFLTMDAVQKAQSGHAGAPLGMADIATVLFKDFMRFDVEGIESTTGLSARALPNP